MTNTPRSGGDVERGCRCQVCGRLYKLDVIVSDEHWNLVRPAGREGEGGLLCGGCITARLEERLGFSGMSLTTSNAAVGDEVEPAPRDGSVFYSVVRIPMRWASYKPASEQFRRGLKGRWQQSNGYGGWDSTLYNPDEFPWEPVSNTGGDSEG